HRREAVAADLEDVVHAAQQPEIALLVALGAVAGEVPLAELRPVGLLVALGIAVDAAQHPGPGRLDHQQPRVDRLALLVHDVGVDAGEGDAGGAGLGLRDAGQRRDQDVAGLGLPPGVDDRTAAAADHL